MTLRKFFLRYTAVPFLAIVLVSAWALRRESVEIDARQYASLVTAYRGFPPVLQRAVSRAMHDGRIDKSEYADLMRESLRLGYTLTWPAASDDERPGLRARLAMLCGAPAP